MQDTLPESSRRIKIKWPQVGITVTAHMNDTVNPRLIDLLFEHLPYRSLQNHALVSGDHLYHLVPSEMLIYTHADYKVPDRTLEPDGTVFLSGLQHLAIKYGPLSEYLPAAPCGNVIPEDMENLRLAGNAVWKACNKTKQIIEVIVWDASQPEPTEHLPLQLERIGVTDEVKALVHRIHDETERYWSGICPDIETVHNGLAGSLAGSKGSYFATMVFLNGEVRPLGYNILNNILAVAATQPHFDLQHLITLYRVFTSTPSEFVGYTGATFLCSTYRQIDALITERIQPNPDTEQAREDFLAMISAFARYVNLLNAQNLHIFPWRHTIEYPMNLN
ncbi:cucumopine synthase [Aspergillus heteromorphus CBS 117.55]|uniref:Cucumopine synthase n=1 Tax=Aspergillus heteromorphus CBS 117.55 TaxID=1448321 RepID=A0A317VK48_9EURO|nr:cucumopine synthase [Aspergillus heteromorphus CBS 117.55]PWY72280.1 cucumopine synthase [Aspergillus heteromorphus CBS 117.55]